MVPTFTLRHTNATQHGSLFDLFTAVDTHQLVDLPAMRAHQRPAVVTAIAVMMHALLRYAAKPPQTAEDWEAAWRAQVGADALRLFAPWDEVAFFQPPLPAAPNSTLDLSAVDYTLIRQAHERKPVQTGTPEAWVFALMSSGWSLSVAKWHGGARQGAAVVLPSDDGTLGGEIRCLMNAYRAMTPSIVGTAVQPVAAAEHLLWMRPHDKTLPLDEVPYPCVETKPVHLVEGDFITAVGRHSCPVRIQRGGHLEDPHIPTANGTPYKVVKSRKFDARFQHNALFGSADVLRPRVLDLATYRTIRLCAIGSDTGKTKGYWHAFYTLHSGERGFSLAPPSEADRASDLSQRALGVMDDVSKVLRSALATLLAPESKHDPHWGYINGCSARLRDTVAAPTVSAVLDLLDRDSDLVEEQRVLGQAVVPVMLDLYRQAETAVADYLRCARAEQRLRWGLKDVFGEMQMNDKDQLPDLAKQCYAVINDIASRLTPEDRARLRTMYATEPPMIYWTLLAQVPVAQAEDQTTEAVWRAVLMLLGRMRQGKAGVGRLLRQTEMPEPRVQQLLGSTGETLRTLIESEQNNRWGFY